MYRLTKKLKALKPVLRSFSKTHCQGIHKRVDDARECLLQTQRLILASSSPPHDLLSDEEFFLTN